MENKKLFVENARILGMTFLFLHESRPEAEVDMMETSFNACGTIACHAGWFAVARGLEDGDNSDLCPYYEFQSSAKDMAQFLGINGENDMDFGPLGLWAEANPKLWGNRNGKYIFSCETAFGKNRGERLSLQDIGIHWLKVADRVEKV